MTTCWTRVRDYQPWLALGIIAAEHGKNTSEKNVWNTERQHGDFRVGTNHEWGVNADFSLTRFGVFDRRA